MGWGKKSKIGFLFLRKGKEEEKKSMIQPFSCICFLCNWNFGTSTKTLMNSIKLKGRSNKREDCKYEGNIAPVTHKQSDIRVLTCGHITAHSPILSALLILFLSLSIHYESFYFFGGKKNFIFLPRKRENTAKVHTLFESNLVFRTFIIPLSLGENLEKNCIITWGVCPRSDSLATNICLTKMSEKW